MKFDFSFKSVLSVLLLLWSVCCFGQRQTPGRPGFSLMAEFSDGPKGVFPSLCGGSATWNTYQYIGNASFGVDFSAHGVSHTDEAIYDAAGTLLAPEFVYALPCYDLTAGGGYFVRLLATRSRSVILSAGAGLYAGVRVCPELGKFDTGGTIGFLLNGYPELHFEFFPFSNVSVLVYAKPRMEILGTLSGIDVDWFRFAFGFGMKYYL